jgi:hypothetical protein
MHPNYEWDWRRMFDLDGAGKDRPVVKGVQIWMHPVGICKISKTNMLISPLKNM